MNIQQEKTSTYDIFAYLGLYWVFWGWLGLSLAISGLFYRGIIIIYLLAGIIALIYKFQQQKWKVSREIALVILVSLAIASMMASFSTPTIFSGRDQGSFSEAAIRLAHDHKMTSSFPAQQEFYNIYGEGKALNFPGFNYTADGKLTTHLSIGYVSWLATFYTLFGLSGLAVANAIPFFLFLVSLYLLSGLFTKPINAAYLYLVVVTSFIFSWLIKFTLSENLALGLLWFSILYLILFLRKKDKFYFFIFFVSLSLLAFTRIETIAFFLMSALVILISYKGHLRKMFGEIVNKPILLTAGIMLLLYLVNLKVNYPFYHSSLKGLFSSFTGQAEISDPTFSLAYVLKILNGYALLHFLFVAIIALAYYLKHKEWERLIPFMIVLPTFIYLFHPGISADHPWMLRRFSFSVIPITLFLSVPFIAEFARSKMITYALMITLALSNLSISIHYLFFSENTGLLPQIEELSGNFKQDDLVLVDRSATGDGWSMMSGPLNFLAGKQAVYFFNVHDLAKLDLTRFSQVYFIIPDTNLSYYEKADFFHQLTPVKDYHLETTVLDIHTGSQADISRFPIKPPQTQRRIVNGKIYRLGN